MTDTRLNAAHENCAAVERAAWQDLFRAPPPRLVAELALTADPLDRSVVLRCPVIDSLLLNRTVAVAPSAAQSRDLAESIVARYRARDIHRYFVQLPVLPGGERDADGFRHRLGALGLERYRRDWIKYIRGDEPPPRVTTELSIHRALRSDAQAVGRIMAAGFDLPPAGADLWAATVQRSGWHAYLATRSGEPAAAAILYTADGVGYLIGAATLPRFRKLGAQGALMRKRIEVALDLGCHTIFTETGAAVPGQPNHSATNMLRCGHREAYRIENWAPKGTAWNHRATAEPTVQVVAGQ